MSDPVLHYLIVFNRKVMVSDVIEFGENIDAALAKYAEKEREFLNEPSVEVVLVGSASLDDVRETHPNYFPDEQTANGWLMGLGLDHDAIFGKSRWADASRVSE